MFRFCFISIFLFLWVCFDVGATSKSYIAHASFSKDSHKSLIQPSHSRKKKKTAKGKRKLVKKNIKRGTRKVSNRNKTPKLKNNVRSKKNKKSRTKKKFIIPNNIPALEKALIRQRRLFKKASKTKKKQIKKRIQLLTTRLDRLKQHQARHRQREEERLRQEKADVELAQRIQSAVERPESHHQVAVAEAEAYQAPQQERVNLRSSLSDKNWNNTKNQKSIRLREN